MMRYDGALYNRAYDFKYPKAGDANSVVTPTSSTSKRAARRRSTPAPTPRNIFPASAGRRAGSCGTRPATAVSSRSSSAGWRPTRSRRRRRSSRRSTASVRPAMWATKPTVCSAGSTADAASSIMQETATGWMHLYLGEPGEPLRALTEGRWGGDRHRRSRRPRGLLHLDRAVAARTQPLRRRLQGTAQTPAHARQGGSIRSLRALECYITSRPSRRPTIRAGGDLRTPGDAPCAPWPTTPPCASGRQHPSAAQGVLHLHDRTRRHAGRLHRPPRRVRSRTPLPLPADAVFGARLADGAEPLETRLGRRAGTAGLRGSGYRRPRHGLPRRGVQEEHLRPAGASRSRRPAVDGTLHGRAAVDRRRAHRHLRLVVRRLHGPFVRLQRRRAVQGGRRRGARHLVALLRHDFTASSTTACRRRIPQGTTKTHRSCWRRCCATTARGCC